MLYNNLTVNNYYLPRKSKQILIKIKCYEKTYFWGFPYTCAYLVRFCISLKNIEPSLKNFYSLYILKSFCYISLFLITHKLKKNYLKILTRVTKIVRIVSHGRCVTDLSTPDNFMKIVHQQLPLYIKVKQDRSYQIERIIFKPFTKFVSWATKKILDTIFITRK